MTWIQYCHTSYYISTSFSKTNAPSGNKNLIQIYFLECFVKICSSFKNTMESFSLYSNVFFPLICIHLLTSLRKNIFSRRRISFLFCCYKLKYNFYPFQKTLVTIPPQESHHTGEPPCLSKDHLLGVYFSNKTSRETKVQSIPMMSFTVHSGRENLYFKFMQSLRSRCMKVQHSLCDHDTFLPET